MNRKIASLTIGTALTLAVASGLFFTSSSPSVGQSNTGAVASVRAEQLDTLEQGEKSTNTSDDPIADFLADENWITIPAGTYEVGCNQKGTDCDEVQIESFRISAFRSNMLLNDSCVKENTKLFAQLGYIDQAPTPHSPSQWMWSEYLSCFSGKTKTTISLPTTKQVLAAVAFRGSIFEDTGASSSSFLTQTCEPVESNDELYGFMCTSVSCKKCEIVRVFSGFTSVISRQDDDLQTLSHALLVRDVNK